MVRDMTKGSPFKLLLMFSIPLLIGNLFQQLYSMVDTIIVGKCIGLEALAAVGSTGAISFLVIGFVQGVTSGFSIVTAQRFGAQDEEGVRKSVGISIILCVVITIVLTLISVVFTMPLLRLMKTPENIIHDAYIYIVIIFAGIGPAVYYNMIAGILRALGDSKTPLYFLGVSSALNIALDLILIIYFKMGVSGAAVATVVSQLISALLCTFYTAGKYTVLKLNKYDLQFDINNALLHLRVGLPMAFQFSITAVGVMIIQIAINSFGSDGVAAFTAASKVEMLVTQPFAALGTAIATYCGQNRGAGRMDRVRLGMRACLIMCAVACVISSSLNVFCGRFFTELFVDGAEEIVLSYSQRYLNILACFYPSLGILYVFRNALQGIGEALVPFFGGVAEFAARIAVANILPAIIGFTGVCLASPVAWVAAIIPLVARYIIIMRKEVKKASNI